MKEGEVVEFKYHDGTWHCALINYIGIHVIVGIDADGDEVTISRDLDWRYPPNPIKELRDQMLEEWRGHTLDTAHDDEFSRVRIGYFFDWLIEHGYVGVE